MYVAFVDASKAFDRVNTRSYFLSYLSAAMQLSLVFLIRDTITIYMHFDLTLN